MRTLGMFMDGNAPEIRDPEGLEVRDHNYLVLLNAHHESVDFKIPKSLSNSKWKVALNTFQTTTAGGQEIARRTIRIEGRSLIVLFSESDPPEEAPDTPPSP
jgi:isoamylase